MRCSFCHDSFASSSTPCADCATQLHPDCWREAGECPSLGCEGRPARRLAKAWVWTWLLCLIAGFNHLRRPAAGEDKAAVPRICFCNWGDVEVRPELKKAPETTCVEFVGATVRALAHHWNDAAAASYFSRQHGPQDLTVLEEIRERRRRRS